MTTQNNPNFKIVCQLLLEMALKGEITDDKQLSSIKKKLSKQYKLSGIPKNADIIAMGNEAEQIKVRDMLQRKPVRTISGVAVIAAMTSPAPCPHGICTPCPGGPDSEFCSPQSYMGQEPSTMRAIQNEYHPYKIVSTRLKQLKNIGHDVTKAELIVMGGTFSARSIDYQEW